jgi:hypothetical protein
MLRKKLKALTLRITLIPISILVTLFVLEIAVRLFMPQQLVARQPHMYKPDYNGFGWKHHANVNTVVNTGERTVQFRTDENGFRIGVSSQTSSNPDYKILALGDSFLEALQVEYEQTMTAHIENSLSAQIGIDVVVINTGVGAWGPNQYLMQAEEELANRDYDLVLVFLFSPNDIEKKSIKSYPPRMPAKKHVLRIPKNMGKAEIIDSWLYPVNDFLEERSHLYIFLKKSLSVTLAKLGLTAYYFPRTLELSYANSPSWATTADICAEIAREAHRYNVPIIFIHLPGPYTVNKETLDWYVNAFDIDPATIDVNQASRILKEEFEARELILLDTSEPLRLAYESGIDSLYGKIDQHFSPNGHRVVGEYITEWLLKSELLPPGRR